MDKTAPRVGLYVDPIVRNEALWNEGLAQFCPPHVTTRPDSKVMVDYCANIGQPFPPAHTSAEIIGVVIFFAAIIVIAARLHATHGV